MDARSKKLIAGGVIAGGLMLGAAGLVIGVGIAKGDVGGSNTSGYLIALEEHGINVDPAWQMVSAGFQACTDMAEGIPGPTLIPRVAATVPGVPYSTVEWVVIDASVYLCPAIPFDAQTAQTAGYVEKGGHRR